MFFFATVLASLAEPTLPIIPKPVSMSVSSGEPFKFSAATKLVSDCKATDFLKSMVHMSLKGSGKGNKVVFRHMSDTRRMRPDWYTMKVTSKEITVDYTSEGGAFYAVQTLRQLLPVELDGPKQPLAKELTVPACEISDGPRFPWRGMLLDCSRHFWDVDFVKKTIDRLAMLKMNVFHWHLVDDGGWRIEIKKYPNLTKMGAWRMDTGEVWPGGGWNFANLQFVGEKHPKKYGGYYSQAQIKDIVKYAAARHVTVVPEIEMPGHSLGAILSYPDLVCQNVKPADKPGKSVSNVYCAGNDNAIKFLEDVLDETMALFPSQSIHIGADEVMKDFWHDCPRCQARMKKEGLKNEHELQSWFVKHFDTYLTKHGRRLVGWDEILEGGLAEGATVMSWRGIEGGIAAAKAGRDVIMTPTSHCYFDYPYTSISTEQVLGWQPVPSELTSQESSHILGGQYNVWTEWIATKERCEELQFPRALAMAEVLWSPDEQRDYKEFSGRQAKMMSRLEAMGVNYHLPAPTVQYNTIFTTGSSSVVADSPEGVPFQLRYTKDGSKPGSKSPLYTGGVKIDQPCTLSFAFVTGSGLAGDVTKVDCRPYENLVRGNMEPGLAGATYLLSDEPIRLPKLATAPVHGAFNATSIDDSVRPRPAQFAVSWGGFLKIPATGAYKFSLKSDDGSMLWLNNAVVVDNDGLHGAVEKSGTAWLPAGVYLFRLEWFDQGGANSLSVSMTPPGGAKGPLPSDWLFRPSH